MDGQSVDERLIRQYLLGKLQGGEQETVERALFTDNDCFADLLALEDELIDEFVAGDLSGDELERFQTHFLCNQERLEKLEFARMFGKYVAGNRRDSSPVAADASSQSAPIASFSLIDYLFRFRPLWGYSLAALLALIIAGGIWISIQSSKFRRSYETEHLLNAQLNQAVGDEKAKRTEAEMKLGKALSIQSPKLVASISLTQGAVRSEGHTPSVSITPDKLVVELDLETTSTGYAEYEATIVDDRDQLICQSGKLESQTIEGAVVARWWLSANTIPSGDYQVRLYRIDSAGTRDLLGSYPIRVVRK